MNVQVLQSLLPVALLIAAGVLAGKLGWLRQDALKDLSNLVFLVFGPALMFRTMAQVHLEELAFKPVAAYFVAIFVIFLGILVTQGFSRRSTVMALAGTFSNTVMIGTALVSLLFGPAGLVVLLTLVSLHALVMLTCATLVLEMAVQREQAAGLSLAARGRWLAMAGARALGATLLHPATLPILLGLVWAQTGLAIPAVLDKPLALLSQAFAPLALVLVGLSLSFTRVGPHWRGALALAGVKNLLHPALVWSLCHAFGVEALATAIMVTAAALPIGANVFLFSQRYGVAQELVTASMALSTFLAVFTLSALLLVIGQG